ncbi:heme ABC exporter ATP-binding protein CcmA [Actinocrispum wychmicini]|uniref:Heme ABC exporter ATP-binding subunit CcmA n=1 Tax=Actinocrispum wychmicini TaxID=1213861 RepID=A0A4R2IXT0_9PSEU|nr:heme ABC exporter ATP-binding protein CcmA [Actinocrispum wychmicini]TCO50641.1 heme ABC exporter ATP-binding subunit CcmA [Actinocrispum wychmicini]
MAALLTVTDLAKSYGDVPILTSVTFELHSAQALALTGPNGSGKTTLLKCVAGADLPDSGEVRLNGEPFTESDPKARAAIACALDDADFFPELSVAEHLELFARAHGMPEPKAVVDDVVAELDLTDQRDQLPVTLSSGQRRRLTLGACLVRPRRLLILDEPEQRLDSAGRDWLARRLTDEKANGTAILLATHSEELTDAVADYEIDLGE